MYIFFCRYIYTGQLKIAISPKNLTHLMLAATHLEINEINLGTLANLLQEKISPKTCWLIKEVARELEIPSLITHMDSWMKRNFVEIVAETEFLDVQIDDVRNSFKSLI